jgi:hypothetical protein
MLDPVVDHAIANSKVFGRLLDGQLLGLLKHSRWDTMAFADPLDHLRRVWLARGAGISFPVELVGDLGIEQAVSQISDAVDNRERIPHTVRYVGRELHAEVGAGASLPTDVGQELFLVGGLLDGNILDEQPQHPLAVFGLCAGSMPQTRQVPC